MAKKTESELNEAKYKKTLQRISIKIRGVIYKIYKEGCSQSLVDELHDLTDRIESTFVNKGKAMIVCHSTERKKATTEAIRNMENETKKTNEKTLKELEEYKNELKHEERRLERMEWFNKQNKIALEGCERDSPEVPFFEEPF